MSLPSTGTTSLHWLARLRRRDANSYLLEEHGVSLSPAMLAKLATIGGRPSFRNDGPFSIYERSDLDAFSTARLGPLHTGTSDRQAP